MRRFLLGAALLAWCPGWVAYGETGVVSGSYINVRDAGRINSGQVAKKFRGDRFEILNERDNWLEVRFDDGTQGWIAKWLVKTGREADAITGSMATAAGSGSEPREGRGSGDQRPGADPGAPSSPGGSSRPDVASRLRSLAATNRGDPVAAAGAGMPFPAPSDDVRDPGRQAVDTASPSGSVSGAAEPGRASAGEAAVTDRIGEGGRTDARQAAAPVPDETAGHPAAPSASPGREGPAKPSSSTKDAALGRRDQPTPMSRMATAVGRDAVAPPRGAALPSEPRSRPSPPAVVPTDAAAPVATASVPVARSAEEFYNLGIEWFEKKQYQRALEANLEALRLAPGQPEILNNAANCQFKLGNFQEAIQLWQQALELAPKSAKICNNIGIAYYQLDENAKAIEYYRKAMLFDAGFADSYYNLASVHGYRGEYREAIDNYRKFLDTGPDAAMKALAEERIDYCNKQLKQLGESARR